MQQTIVKRECTVRSRWKRLERRTSVATKEATRAPTLLGQQPPTREALAVKTSLNSGPCKRVKTQPIWESLVALDAVDAKQKVLLLDEPASPDEGKAAKPLVLDLDSLMDDSPLKCVRELDLDAAVQVSSATTEWPSLSSLVEPRALEAEAPTTSTLEAGAATEDRLRQREVNLQQWSASMGLSAWQEDRATLASTQHPQKQPHKSKLQHEGQECRQQQLKKRRQQQQKQREHKQQQQQQHEQPQAEQAEAASGPPSVLEACARAVEVRLVDIGRTASTVELLLRLPSGDAVDGLRFDVVATPLHVGAGRNPLLDMPLVEQCQVTLRSSGATCGGEVKLVELDPALAYNVVVEVRPALRAAATPAVSDPVVLPQRGDPARWSMPEVLLWCASLQVEVLAGKVREYRIDGTTLLALAEADLRGLGLADPTLRRRVLDGLDSLRKT